MLCLQLFLCLGREVWFFKVTYRRNLSTLETRNIPLALTPWTLAESFPAREGAVGWRSAMWSCSADCLTSLGPRVREPKGRAVVPTSGAASRLLPYHPSGLPFMALAWGQAFCLSSSETVKNSLPSFTPLLRSATSSWSSEPSLFLGYVNLALHPPFTTCPPILLPVDSFFISYPCAQVHTLLQGKGPWEAGWKKMGKGQHYTEKEENKECLYSASENMETFWGGPPKKCH